MTMTNFQDSETVMHTLQGLGRFVRAQRWASGLRIDAAALCGVSVDLLSRLGNGRSATWLARARRLPYDSPP